MSERRPEALELLTQARTLASAGRHAEAAETYIGAVQLGVDDQPTWIALARLLMRVDWPRVDRAVTAGLHIREADADLSAAWAARAVLAGEQKDERLGVWSRDEMVRIDFEDSRIIGPGIADRSIGCSPP